MTSASTLLADLSTWPEEGETFDVVVIGAGGAGLSAALFASIDHARVLLVERTAHVGGTTAWSEGTTWIPATHHGVAVDPDDSIDVAERDLAHAVGQRSSGRLRRKFLESGPQVVEHLEANTDVRYRASPMHADDLSEFEGSTLPGRALEPLPFDGRRLGDLFALVRPPIPEVTRLGGMMVDRDDIDHLRRMRRSFASLRHALELVARHARDRLRHPRGTRLVMGNALVGGLLHSLAQRPAVLAVDTEVERLEADEQGVFGATLSQRGVRRTVRARGGVVLATGGFNRHPRLRAALLPGIDARWCAVAPGATGVAQELALGLGARHGEGALSAAFWAPVSLRTRGDGTTGVFPHFVRDRGRPGTLAIDPAGRRFVDETTSSHLFALAMQQANAIPAYLVADARALSRHGLGIVRPGGRRLAPRIADGYLRRGTTLDELAHKLGIDAAALRGTVERFNRHALIGVDPDFGRGGTACRRSIGDAPIGGSNPTLAPLTSPPYYAVALYPGDIGAATGLACDEAARALDRDDRPIPGLYAVGDDMQSPMGGVSPGPGISLGTGLVFAYLAARHAAMRAVEMPATRASAYVEPRPARAGFR